MDISNNLFVKNDVSINNALFVNNDISVNNNIFVGGDISINNDLFINNDISVNNHIFVGEDVSINNNLFVKRDVSINNLLRVPHASFDKIALLNENEALQILPDVSFQGMVEISNNLTVAGDDISFNNNLFVGNDVSINNRLFVNNNVLINKKLTVPDVSFNKIGPINTTFNVIGDLSVNGTIRGLKTKSFYSTIFNDISSGNSDMYSVTPWISDISLVFNKGSILLHNIKANAYVSDNCGNEPLILNLTDHNWILSRKTDSTDMTVFHTFNQIFNRIDNSEDINYSFTEILPSKITYNKWRVDFSGNGARNNLEKNKLTWNIITFGG